MTWPAPLTVHGSPVVLARRADGSVDLLMAAEQLDRLGGSVVAFEAAARSTLAGVGQVPPIPRATGPARC